MADSPMSIDIWMKQGSKESSLWSECGIIILHVQIKNKSAFRIRALRWLCGIRMLNTWIKICRKYEPLA